MNKQQAIDFITAVNAAQPYVPPILFAPIINSEIARLAVLVANDAARQQQHEPVPKGNGAAIQEQPSG